MNETESGRTESLCIAHVSFPSFVSCCALTRRSPYARSMRDTYADEISRCCWAPCERRYHERTRAAVFEFAFLEWKNGARAGPHALFETTTPCANVDYFSFILSFSISLFISLILLLSLFLSLYFLSFLSIYPVNHTWFISPRRVGRRPSFALDRHNWSTSFDKTNEKNNPGDLLFQITFRLMS